MTNAERIERLNRWYDDMPEEYRFQMIAWPIVAVGAINMALSIAFHFPFGLLLLLAIAVVACVRVPFLLGWVTPGSGLPEHGGPGTRIEINSMSWLYDLNRWYDDMPELRRPWVILAVLGIAGFVNMVLTINAGFTFGVLFLLALLVLVALRAPYAAGWLATPGHHQITVAPHAEQIASAPYHEPITHEVGSSDQLLPVPLNPDTPSADRVN